MINFINYLAGGFVVVSVTSLGCWFGYLFFIGESLAVESVDLPVILLPMLAVSLWIAFISSEDSWETIRKWIKKRE